MPAANQAQDTHVRQHARRVFFNPEEELWADQDRAQGRLNARLKPVLLAGLAVERHWLGQVVRRDRPAESATQQVGENGLGAAIFVASLLRLDDEDLPSARRVARSRRIIGPVDRYLVNRWAQPGCRCILNAAA